jgi:hypothetical protein
MSFYSNHRSGFVSRNTNIVKSIRKRKGVPEEETFKTLLLLKFISLLIISSI